MKPPVTELDTRFSDRSSCRATWPVSQFLTSGLLE